jgi:hypothetical protein
LISLKGRIDAGTVRSVVVTSRASRRISWIWHIVTSELQYMHSIVVSVEMNLSVFAVFLVPRRILEILVA